LYLKKIEIYGFKSFADKIQLEFENGITAVVGPNGSGKSNIADAVRWVLGEQSAKSLRGSKMEDVIFAGTQKRKPLGYAEVSLVIDNSLDILPIDYNEVRITRRVFRSGESEFYINKTSCRLKDIHQLLMDTGLGKEGYSLIGQGKIDEILSANSQDRRYIFEEAAGIVKYKSRKNEAEKKLDRTEQNLIRIIDIIKELENQIHPLSIQAEKAKKYITIKDYLKEKELAVFIHRIDSLKDKQKNINTNKKNIESQIKEKESEIEEIEGANNKLKNDLKEKEVEINNSQSLLYDIRSKIEKNQSEIKLLNERIEYINENKKRVALEIDEDFNNINNHIEEKSIKENELNKFNTHIKERSNILKEEKEKLFNIKKVLKEKEDNMDERRQNKLDLINNLADIKSSINGLNIMSNSIKVQLNQMSRQYSEYKEKMDSQNILKLETLQKQKIIEEENIEINNTKGALHSNLNKANNTLKDLQDKSKKIYNEIQIKQSKAKVLVDMDNEYEGYYKSVKKLMLEKKKNKNLSENIYGVIAELINVPSKYVIAIERALGSSIQNIVVKDEFIAQECIKLLNDNSWGRATFLPVEVIKGKKINKELNILKSHKGFIGIASDLIKYDKAFKQIIEQLLGRVILVKEMEDGISLSRKLNHKYKIVTLNGVVFNSGGSIIGGSNSINNTGILSRQQEIKELSKEINLLKNNYDNMNLKINNLIDRIKEIQSKVDRLIEKISNNEIEMININNSLKQINIEKQRIDNELIKIQNDTKSFNLEIKELEEKEVEYKEKISRINKKLNMINDEINTSININEEEKEKAEKLNNEIIQLEIDIAKIQQRIIESENQLTHINKNIENSKNSIQEKKIKFKNYDRQIDENIYKIDEKNEYIKVLSEEKFTKEKHINILLQKKDEAREEIELHEEKLKEYNKQLVVSNNALHKTIIQLNKIEMEMENLKNTIYEDYQTTYNLALGYKREINNLQKTYSEIKRYKNQIRELGNVNIDSIEEYERVLERFTFLSKQREDLDDAKNSLNDIIEEITFNMEKQFQEQFNIIKEEFNNVFTRLFQGGYAKVFLSEPKNALTSGVAIEVQPPGKKLQNLSLLSGGERALTAIALLFAILRVKPTPFCILDEIEAALDEPNVNRYASFLKEFSKSTQFIAVTHRKGTMEIADILYGVTMEEQGVSKLISVKLTELAS